MKIAIEVVSGLANEKEGHVSTWKLNKSIGYKNRKTTIISLVDTAEVLKEPDGFSDKRVIYVYDSTGDFTKDCLILKLEGWGNCQELALATLGYITVRLN